jgi:hypothetical protein
MKELALIIANIFNFYKLQRIWHGKIEPQMHLCPMIFNVQPHTAHLERCYLSLFRCILHEYRGYL